MSVAPETPVSDLPDPVPGTLLDVREDDEWRAGHAPDAVHIPLAELPARFGELDLDAPLHVVCRSGGRSARAAAWLQAQGVDATNVAGGMDAWLEHGRPLTSEDGRPPRVL
jgi:rhodanese-related sulfurtransferase